MVTAIIKEDIDYNDDCGHAAHVFDEVFQTA
jgi:hypothetical protein